MTEMPPVAVLGVDPSLTGTGLASGPTLQDLQVASTTTATPMIQRIDYLAHVVCTNASGTDLVLLEGFSYGSRGRSLFDIAGLGWVIRHELRSFGYRWAVMSPSSLKQFATGKGNANKAAMAMAAFRRGGIDLTERKSDEDRVDAWWAWQAGMHLLGHPQIELPQSHLKALEKIEMGDHDEW